MTVRNFLLFIGFGTVLSSVAVILVVWRVDPYTAGMIGHLLFYISLFFALFGTAALIGFGGRILIFKDAVAFRHIGVSLRQGIILSTLLTCTLLLIGNDLLRWWNAALLFAGLVLLEGFFQLSKPKRR